MTKADMTSDETAVEATVRRFYDGIESMMRGDGLDAIRDTWHHTDRVSSGHPSGDWAHGWDEVWATWTVFGSLGRPEFAGTRIRALTVHVHGDFAYTTCVFEGVPVLGGERLACTNVLHRVDGEWKLVHHHADKAPLMGAILEKLAQGEDPAG